MTREELNVLSATTAGPTVDEVDHFMVCPVCRQAFDMRNLGDVFYHDEPDHEPLLLH